MWFYSSTLFKGIKHPGHDPKDKENIIEFEDAMDEERYSDENKQNDFEIMKRSNSIDSEKLSSSLEDVHNDAAQAQHSNMSRREGTKPLTAHNSLVPNVVEIGKLYEQKKQLRYRQTLQKEREQRKFHAKPAPNFAAIHAAHTKRREMDEPKITIPVTPNVVLHHRQYLEKIRAKVSSISNRLFPVVK